MTNANIGSTFESCLEKQGFKDEVDLIAQKRVIAWQIEQAMVEGSITKAEMAARMNTSRTQVDRLLDPQNNRVQLDTLQRAALAVGRSLKVELARMTPAVDGGARRRKVARGGRNVAARGKSSRQARKKTGRPRPVSN